MATDIPPFQLHLMLKLHSGKQLTLNEIRKAQEMGIDSPWPPTESAPFENASGEEQQEAAAPFQQTQKVRFDDRTVPSYPWSPDPDRGYQFGPVMRVIPPVRRNPEPFFPTRRDVVTTPGDGEGDATTTAGDDIMGYPPSQDLRPATNKSQYQYQIPDWARATQRDSNGNPIPRWPISNGQDGRLDRRYPTTQYFRLATNKSQYQYQIPDWARATQRDSNGNPIPRYPISNEQDGRLDQRYPRTQYFHLATNKSQYQYQIPDWARATQRDSNGNPIPRWPISNGQDGRLDRRYPTTQYQRRAVDGSTANVNDTTIKPDQIYSWPGSGVGLRIGTGGSDQSGLLVKLLDGYLQHCVEVKKETPFVVEFYESDSGVTIDYLSENIIDIGITDSVLLDTLATNQGIIDRRETGWRDHWMLVGPQNNPAKLPENSETDVHAVFSALYTNLNADPGSSTVFLSRSDGSASYVKESSIWSAIGRAPSASAAASWYASSESSALETLAEAAMIGAYTLTDSGIWHTAPEESRNGLTIFAVGKDDDKDPLLKRAELVISSNANNKHRANDFVDWVVRADGGQKVIGEFSSNGTVVFSPAPLPGSVTARPNGTTNGLNPKTDNLDKTTDGVDKKTNQSSEQKPPPKTKSIPRAILHLNWSVDQVYFFDGPKYIRLDAVDKTKTGSSRGVKDQWPVLADIPNELDAVLPVNKEEKAAWVFSGDSCIVMDVGTGKPYNESKLLPWGTVFRGLKERSGFESIDCVVPHFWKGGDPSCSTFFSGTKEIVFSANKGKPESDASITSSLLASMTFTKVDAFTFVPGTDFEEGYFFSGGHYAHVKLQSGTVLGVRGTHTDWLGLAAAGLFG